MSWLLSSDVIAAIIQICILIVLILTFLHAHRPHVGVIGASALYDNEKKDLIVILKAKNTGNVPANNVSTNMKMLVNSSELHSLEGGSRYVLFPNQENTGNPVFHNVEHEHIHTSVISIIVEINYEQPISSFLPIPVTIRKYKTTQELSYDANTGNFAAISGCAT